MNLYIQRRANLMWPHLLDADSKIVGTVRPDVADHLVKIGAAMDLGKSNDTP